MRVRAHIATSAVLSGLLFLIFSRSISMAIAAFLSGVLIDLDHVFEGYMNFGMTFNVWNTIKVSENCEFKKVHIFLHSYELLLIYVLVIYWFRLGNIWLGIAAGLTLHLLLDGLVNCLYPNSLFFIKRWKLGFDAPKIIDIQAQRKKHGLID